MRKLNVIERCVPPSAPTTSGMRLDTPLVCVGCYPDGNLWDATLIIAVVDVISVALPCVSGMHLG